MTTENVKWLYTVQAQADLTAQSSRFKVITLNGTLHSTASPLPAVGILISSARSGEYATYCFAGVQKGVAGAAVASLGWPVAIASGGFLTNAVSGGTTVGRFLETANSGDFVQAIVDFSDLGVYSGN